ncbi:peptidoglycan-binding domain-containing protein [Bauldia litoralis]|uniref:peptidoglycan-binding domain-containing protein n=1 Tax=Bauldia litoralis TaxID=665467 RepID=UPI003299BF5E
MAARSTSRRQPAAEIDFEDEEVAGDGVMARVFDRAIANPAMSSGLVVMALTVAAVVSNAVFLQKARHPEPLFMTRPSPVAAAEPALEPVVPDPRPRAAAQMDEASLSAIADESVPVPTPAPPLPKAIPDQVIITELQRKLADKGLYDGKVDGISGSRTEAAIVAYQKSAGLAVTGKPTADILVHMNTASVAAVRPEPASAPEQTPIPVNPPIEGGESVEPLPVNAVPSEPVEAAPVDIAPVEGDAVASAIEIATRNRFVAVQRALNRIGYGPVAEDGLPSDEVANAVRRFELDNGLPITGEPDEQVVERLVSIGAMQSI